MENVRQCITDANDRKYGLWALKDDATVSRKCKCCGIDFDYPIGKNQLEQIKKQQVASKLLESFLNLSLDDPNLIGYLNVIFEDVVDYIDDVSKSLLDKKLEEILKSAYFSEENRILLQGLMFATKNNDYDLFINMKEYFDECNSESLMFFEDNKKSISK